MIKLLITIVTMCLIPCSVIWAEPDNVPDESLSSKSRSAVHESDMGLLDMPGLTGGWDGNRQRLEDHGIILEASYSGEFVRNLNPGLVSPVKRTVYHDNLDLTLTVDTEKAGLWPGGKFFIYGLRNHGGDPSANIIGDLQTTSNIEAPDQFIVHEAWYEQRFLEGAVSLLVGLHDLNSEFYVSEAAGLFINSSFGIGPEISGNVSTSIFPKAGLGVRTRLEPIKGIYLQAAVYDGDPATRSLKGSEGKMGIVEAGFSRGGGSYKAGYWRHTADRLFGGQVFKDDFGLYGVIDQQLYKGDEDQSLTAFLRYGWVPARRNDITRYVGAGLHLHGMIPARDEDDLGFAVAHASTHLGNETVFELTYRLVLAPWLSMQPSMQWIEHAGGDAAAPLVRVALFRFEVVL